MLQRLPIRRCGARLIRAQGQPGNPWQSGLLDAGGRVKPAWYRFSGAARPVDGQDPLVSPDEDSVLVPAARARHHNAAGTKVTIDVDGRSYVGRLREDGWLEVPIEAAPSGRVDVTASDEADRSISRVVRVQP
jgi:hypothetical protein